MKNLLVGLSIALLAAGTAMGASSAGIIAPAEVLAGEVFEIQVDLQSPENLMLGWFIDGIMATNGAVPGPVTGATAAEQAAYHYGNACGWDTAAASVLLNFVPQTAFPVGPIGGVPSSDGGTNGVAFRMSVQAPDVVGTVIDIFVTGGVYGDPATFDDAPFEEFPVASVTVTPEPVSALLLLAGLAMLRRRR
ncbi:MAG: hypothetical protein GX616_04775 [Planctomycetes bacterium]|nr:hypothetical protein [Planctomycetota bacterium]